MLIVDDFCSDGVLSGSCCNAKGVTNMTLQNLSQILYVESNCHNFQTCYIDIHINHNSSLSGVTTAAPWLKFCLLPVLLQQPWPRGDAMLAKAIPAIHGGFLAGWARWCRGFPMSPVTAPGADRMQMARWGGDGADPTTDTIHGGVHQHNLESSPQKNEDLYNLIQPKTFAKKLKQSIQY